MNDTVLNSLAQFLKNGSRNGLFPIVAYGLDRDAILLLTTAIPSLPLAMDVLEKATGREYNLGRFLTRDLAERAAKENPHVFRLHEATIAGLSAGDFSEVGRVVSIFGAPFFRQKAFGLVDICGFSLLSHPEQLSQLYSLTNVLGSAIRRSRAFCDRLGVRPDFGRASTGDGFYVWHNGIGGNSDVAAFMVFLCIMTQAKAMRQGGFPMRLKGSFVINSAFMLYDSDSTVSPSTPPSNAVGPATNGAARLIAAARPSQILVEDFRRPGQGGEIMDTHSLIAQANELFRVEGAGAAALAFQPDHVVRVVDKHLQPLYCWNLTGEVPNAFEGEAIRRVRIGLPTDEAPSISDIRFRADP